MNPSTVQTSRQNAEGVRRHDVAMRSARDARLRQLDAERPNNGGRLLAFAIVVICMGSAVVGNFDYADALEQQAQRAYVRIERQVAADRMIRDTEATRIWSKRCERQGKDVLALRSDTKPWVIRCVERRVLKV
jgi:hypothetical protein